MILFTSDKMEINKDHIEKKLRDAFEPTYLVKLIFKFNYVCI